MRKIKSIKKKEKGFLGAIGDDLPSLIPIFLSLVIFFSVFLNVFNDYNRKNKIFALNQDIIEISMQLKSDSVIKDHEHFMEKCQSINTTKRWNAFLVTHTLNYKNNPFISLDNYREHLITTSDGSEFICEQDIELPSKKNTTIKPVIYVYPVIYLDEKYFSKPARLYIIIWE